MPLSLQRRSGNASATFPSLAGHLPSDRGDEHVPVFRTTPARSQEIIEGHARENNDGGRSVRAFARAVEGCVCNYQTKLNDDGSHDEVWSGREISDGLLATSDVAAVSPSGRHHPTQGPGGGFIRAPRSGMTSAGDSGSSRYRPQNILGRRLPISLGQA